MEWRNWYLSPSPGADRKDGFYPSQFKWDSLPGLYDRLSEFTQHIPWKHRLILHLCFRGTRIKIDLGDVKAVGIVAVIGLSFGLGSLLLYRLYYRYVHAKNRIKSEKDDKQNDDECHIYLETTNDSGDQKKMGNVQSDRNMAASVHYNPAYGVAIGPNYNNNSGHSPWVRQRKLGSPDSDCHRVRGSQYSDSENDIGLPFVGTEKLCHDARTAKSRTALSPSLIVNCSPQSVQEKRFYYSQSDTKRLSASGNYSGQNNGEENLLNIGNLQDSSVLLTPPDEDYGSYVPQSDQNSISEQSPLIEQSREESPYSAGNNSYSAESLSQDESLRSVRLSEFEGSEVEFGTTSPLPRLSSLDKSFKRNLLRRLSEWTSLSHDPGSKSESGSGSGSLSPDVRSTPERRMKRSVTMGSTSSMSGIESPVTSQLIQGNDIGLRTSKNLEDIEDEIHQIFSEFDYLNSKLDDLKSRNNGNGKLEPLVPDDPEIMAEAKPDEMIQVEIKEAYDHWCRQAQERAISVPLADTNTRLSRGASFIERDLSWDATDIGGDTSVFGKGTPGIIPSVWSSEDRDSADVVKALSNMGERFDDRVWKQIEESTTSDPDLQRKGSISPEDTSMTYDADESNMDGNDTSLDVSGESACSVVSIKSVGIKVDMMVYAAREWKGQTAKSQAIRQGYEDVIQKTGCPFMRQVRGDNYCAIRATLFQLLRQGITINLTCEEVLKKIKKMKKSNAFGINEWSFAKRLKVEDNNVVEKMSCCIQFFFNKIDDFNESLFDVDFHEIAAQDTNNQEQASVENEVNRILEAALDVIAEIPKSPEKSQTNSESQLIKQSDFVWVSCISERNRTFHYVAQVAEVRLLKSEEQRAAWVMRVFNSSGDGDVLLMEAVKLLMFLEAVSLYRDNVEGNAVPSFIWLLFARDTSETPHLFLKNHLNIIGDSGGLEQIEMCLLSYTLGVTIQVFRLSDFGQSDFEATYSGSEETNQHLPTISLLAEDDRHYNVIVA